MRVLLIEDDDDDAVIVEGLFAAIAFHRGPRHQLTRTDLLATALEHLRTEPVDAVLVDLSLPDGHGLEVFAAVNAAAPDVPCVVLSGLDDESLAAEAVHRGAQDYLVKSELSRTMLAKSLHYAVERNGLLLELRAVVAQRTLALAGTSAALEVETSERARVQWSADLYENVVHGIQTGLLICRAEDGDPPELRILAINPAVATMGGVATDEIVGRTVREAYPEQLEPDLHARVAEVARTRTPTVLGDFPSRPPLPKRVFSLKAFPLPHDCVCLSFEDVTERVCLTEQLHQSQKMEAVGRLAGGIAHDFNNILGAILGFGGFVKDALSPTDPAHADVLGLLAAADRAADLVRQLLAFARNQPTAPRVIDLNEIVKALELIALRILGVRIDLTTSPASDLWHIKADPGQMEQVIVNLVVNARDAMPHGGALRIETTNVVIDETWARALTDVEPGEHVRLAVSDSGSGMTDEIKSHIFEPFFTTKEPGKGTGLGLATCYGIVRQGGGHIAVRSEPGQGTTFEIFLPRAHERRPSKSPRPSPGSLLSGSETLLVVEDDVSVRAVLVRSLRQHGYQVLEATSGSHALLLGERHVGPIDLLVTDVHMPSMNGVALAERLALTRPETRVLFVSGYTDKALARPQGLLAGAAFLAKPFSSEVLLRRVRELLGQPPPDRD